MVKNLLPLGLGGGVVDGIDGTVRMYFIVSLHMRVYDIVYIVGCIYL